MPPKGTPRKRNRTFRRTRARSNEVTDPSPNASEVNSAQNSSGEAKDQHSETETLKIPPQNIKANSPNDNFSFPPRPGTLSESGFKESSSEEEGVKKAPRIKDTAEPDDPPLAGSQDVRIKDPPEDDEEPSDLAEDLHNLSPFKGPTESSGIPLPEENVKLFDSRVTRAIRENEDDAKRTRKAIDNIRRIPPADNSEPVDAKFIKERKGFIREELQYRLYELSARIQIITARSQWARHDGEKARKSASTALRRAKLVNYPPLEGRCHFWIGMGELENGLPKPAIQQFELAKSMEGLYIEHDSLEVWLNRARMKQQEQEEEEEKKKEREKRTKPSDGIDEMIESTQPEETDLDTLEITEWNEDGIIIDGIKAPYSFPTRNIDINVQSEGPGRPRSRYTSPRTTPERSLPPNFRISSQPEVSRLSPPVEKRHVRSISVASSVGSLDQELSGIGENVDPETESDQSNRGSSEEEGEQDWGDHGEIPEVSVTAPSTEEPRQYDD